MSIDNLNRYHRWYYSLSRLQPPPKSPPSELIRIGVLSAAAFAPLGIYEPASTHPDVAVVAVAARSLARAQAHAKQYSIPVALGSYDELLALPEVDAVYIPLPIGLHAEWAIKAMRAGKHVLIEKLMCANAEEAKAIRSCSRETGKVAMEAFHWQFHPSSHVVKALVDSGRYGKLLSCQATLETPAGMFSDDDIRLQYDLGGGSCMDFGYVFSAIRYFCDGVGEGDYEVTSAKPRLRKRDERVDEAMVAEMVFRPTEGDREGGRVVKCKIRTDLKVPKILGVFPATLGMPLVTLEMEKGTIKFSNYVGPHYFHNIVVYDKVTGLTTTQKHYSFGPKWGPIGDPWWSTYRYQLEAFVAKLKGEVPKHWVELDESVGTAELIDQVYEKAGMVKRGVKATT